MLAKRKCSAQNLELKTRRHFGWGGNVAPCLVFLHLHLCKISFLYTFRAWKTSRHQSESEFLTFEKKKCVSERERIRRHLLMKSKWSALIGNSINHINAEYLLSVKPTGSALICLPAGFHFCRDLFPALLGRARRLRRGCLVFVSMGVKATCARCKSVWHVGKLNCRIEGSFFKRMSIKK